MPNAEFWRDSDMGPADFAYTCGAEHVRLYEASVTLPRRHRQVAAGWRLKTTPNGHAVLSAR